MNVEACFYKVDFDIFDNHIKGPWKHLPVRFIMVMEQNTNHLTGGASWTIT